jgi:transposase
MSEDDVLFGYRLRVLDYAGRTSVSEACRVFGIHRSTFSVWKRRAERHGLEILRPRERRRPRMPQQLSPFLEERIVAFALGHPGFGPRRIASELARERWGGIVVSPNGVWRCLRRHGLNTRAKRHCRSWRVTPLPTSRRASRNRSGTSRRSSQASWSGSTASTSAGSPARKAPSGS